MPEMDKLPFRKQLRLPDFDYSQSGYYFVTVCAHERQMLFWNSCVNARRSEEDDATTAQLSPLGEIVDRCWNQINSIYDGVKTDLYVIMPDHFHGILIIENDKNGCQPSLQKIMQGFKSVTTRLCFPYGYRQIWQRSYYEHIIRNEQDYRDIAEYIIHNPLKWAMKNSPP